MSMFKPTHRAAASPVSGPSISTTREGLLKRLYLEQLLSPAASLVQAKSRGADIIEGLSQISKILPPQYFYDDRGSQLFEQICGLPEYYPTRTETAILQSYAAAIAQETGACELIELGSGSATKTRILLDAYCDRGYPLRYLPIDVSGGILKQSAIDLLDAYAELEIHGLVGTYELALKRLPPPQLPARMICFLGSTLGNLKAQECDTFFNQIKVALQPGEYFLLGVDLQKSKQQLEAAYNDSQGITAAFNLNMLRHLNWRFDGNFNRLQFRHWSFYNESENQIEMHLKSLCTQTVRLEALDFTVNFKPGETILTEISRKFDLSQIQQELQTYGLTPLKAWTDSNQWFGLILYQLQ